MNDISHDYAVLAPRYVLRNVPETWDAHLRAQCIAGVNSFLVLLATMQVSAFGYVY